MKFIDDLEELEKLATPSPWVAREEIYNSKDHGAWIEANHSKRIFVDTKGNENKPAEYTVNSYDKDCVFDMRLMVLMRNSLPRIIKMLRAAEKLNNAEKITNEAFIEWDDAIKEWDL